jgi:hypothetical protein
MFNELPQIPGKIGKTATRLAEKQNLAYPQFLWITLWNRCRDVAEKCMKTRLSLNCKDFDQHLFFIILSMTYLVTKKSNRGSADSNFSLTNKLNTLCISRPTTATGNQVFNHFAMKDNNRTMEDLWRFIIYRCYVPMPLACRWNG